MFGKCLGFQKALLQLKALGSGVASWSDFTFEKHLGIFEVESVACILGKKKVIDGLPVLMT